MIYFKKVLKKIISPYRIAGSLFSSQYALMLEYRAEIVLWAISGVLPLIMLGLWTGAEARVLAGITKEDITRYFISAFIVRQFTAVWVMVSFEEDHIEGKLSPFILQPIYPFWRYFFSHVAEQFTRIPFVLVIMIFLFIGFPQTFFIPSNKELIAAIIAIFSAFCVRFILHWTFAMVNFWTERASAIERVLMIPYLFLSGLVAPIETFPESVRAFALLTPYPYLLSFPAKILSGANVNLLQGFLCLFLWGSLFMFISFYAWRNGLKQYSSMGA